MPLSRLPVRPRALLAALALLLALSATCGPAAAAPAKREVRSIAYSFVINAHGGWSGPKVGRDPAPWVVDRIIEANPSHLRVTSAASRCDARECYTLQPNSPAIRAELLRLRAAGIRLGAAINTAHDFRGKRRSVKRVVRHACRIKQADRDNLYSWLFLDFMRKQPKRLRIANRIRSGKGCPAGGWQIMTNSSGYKRKNRMPKGAFAHAKRFSLLVGKRSVVRKRLVRAARGRRPVLVESDRRFLADIKRKYRRAWPVLKLEAPHQTGGIFARLSPRTQRSLLTRWAAAGRRLGFKVIHPLFVFSPGTKRGYNSVAEGTYPLITRLIARDG